VHKIRPSKKTKLGAINAYGHPQVDYMHFTALRLFLPRQPVSWSITQQPVETSSGPTTRDMDRPGPEGQWNPPTDLWRRATPAGFAITTTSLFCNCQILYIIGTGVIKLQQTTKWDIFETKYVYLFVFVCLHRLPV